MKLSEAKQEFTRRTKMPAKKAFAELVVASGSLSNRRMASTADWLWVIENICEVWDKSLQLPELSEETVTALNRLRVENEKLRAERNELLTELDKDDQRIFRLEQQLAEVQQEPVDEAEVVAITADAVSNDVAEKIFEGVLSLDFKGWYRRLAVHLHPDTTNLKKDDAQRLFGILNEQYNEQKKSKSRILKDDELRDTPSDCPF